MHNLGRGMWRRVGDFERNQVPQIIRNSQIEQTLQYLDYIKKIHRYNRIQEYRRHILEKVNNPINVETELKYEKPMNKDNLKIEANIQNEEPDNQNEEPDKQNEEPDNQNEELIVEQPEEIFIHEIIAVETELSANEITIPIEIIPTIDKKDPIIFPKKGRKRR